MIKMTRLQPFFSYYGSKWNLSPRYPSPLHGIIIEPFAGSACYSVFHGAHNHLQGCLFKPAAVELYDKSSIICSIWDYLIHVSEQEILSLPLLKPGQKIPITLPIEARNLIGFWTTKGAVAPGKTMTAQDDSLSMGYWAAGIRSRIAAQLKNIRHWKIKQMSYDEIENRSATWFIDPPYKTGGEHYHHSDIDYDHLSEYCQTRIGQVIVCENNAADWLPFRTFSRTKGMRKDSIELIWTNKKSVIQ